MLTLEDYFGRMSRVALDEPTAEIRENARVLLDRVNGLLAQVTVLAPTIEAARRPVVTSGWRTKSYNATVLGAATLSKHITGEAIDLADPDGELDDMLNAHRWLLIEAELWMEHPLATKNWCHLQSVPPRSGNLVFMP